MLSRKACHLIATARDCHLLLLPHGQLQGQEGQSSCADRAPGWAVCPNHHPLEEMRKAAWEAQGKNQGDKTEPPTREVEAGKPHFCKVLCWGC